jgi:ABC-type nitrate/sulfonate/bicarbonate transport system substrate-binding protein
MDQLRILLPTAAASNAVCTLAKREGLFEKYGLEATIEVVGDSSALLAKARQGGAFLAYLAAAATVEAALDGADLVLFAGPVHRPFHSIVCQSAITTPDELRGKRVGYNGRNDELSCRLALRQIGLSMAGDVVAVKVSGPPRERIAVLRSGEVDAVAISPPVTFRAKKAGFRELVCLADLQGDYQSGACAASREFLAGSRDSVVAFTKALSEAVKIYKTDRERALAAMAAHTGGTDREETEDSWRIFALRCTPDVPALSMPGLRFVMDNVIQHPAARSRQPEDFVDLSIVRQLEDEGFYRSLWAPSTAAARELG